MISKQIIDEIKKACEIEIKHQYIDIDGKMLNFSTFMCKELLKIYRFTRKNPLWFNLLELFESYHNSTSIQRQKIIEKLLESLKTLKVINIQNNNQNTSKQVLVLDNDDVTYVKGVGPKFAKILAKNGILSREDLLSYYPRKYVNYSLRKNIADLKVDDEVTIYATVKSVNAFNTKKNLTVLNVTLQDNTGAITITYFYAKVNRYRLESYKKQFPIGASLMMSGKVKRDNYTGLLTLDNPQHQIISIDINEEKMLNVGRIVPVYPLTDELNAKTLRKAIYNALMISKEITPNVLPDYIIQKYNFLNRYEALEQIHFPSDEILLENARKTLAFEEFFLMQTRLAIYREETNNKIKAVPISIKEGGLVERFINSLPFELTNAQKKAVDEILRDMNSNKPMQRLLQGDVGSGKTIVACIMLLSAVENGYQAAIMAPTEILAQQHFNNFISWLPPLGVSVGLFLGSNKKAVREKLLCDLKNGQLNVAIGTHALIQESVEFSNLGAVVIDEQHRFGVEQRTKLKKKGLVPHMLTMCATPIPRTMALTVHGDLDVTIIDEMPKGRKPIITSLMSEGKKKEVFESLKKQFELGHQAYIVYPLIDESESLSAKAATVEAEKLQSGIFKEYKVGLLHGKLSPAEKDRVMEDFKNKKYDVLVCTTVVEVGVDVPNATVMVIENAERFGLSQLHQLRGRVGRNDLQSYCILLSSNRSIETMTRLRIMTETNNGFVVAEKDLELRGPGEYIGTKQSGEVEFSIADLVKDVKLLEQARESAINFVKCKKLDDFPVLKNKLFSAKSSSFEIQVG